MSQTKTFDISEYGIGQLLFDRTFKVPLYQREYSWEESEVGDYFEDISKAISLKKDYFLGSLILTHKDGNFEIIDGQQRLTTTVILIAAIRDYLVSIGKNDEAGEIERDFLFRKDRRTKEITPRITLNVSDNAYFIERILNRPGERKKSEKQVPERERLKTASMMARKIIDRAGMDNIDRIWDWVEFIQNQANVICVVAPDEVNGFVIFETLNDRGLDLGASDLLKNHLFSQAGDRIGEIQTAWIEMLTNLDTLEGKETPVSFMKQVWSLREGATREKELFSKMKAKLQGRDACVDFVNELASESRMYAGFSNPNADVWDGLSDLSREHIATLNLFKLVQPRPLVLALLEHYEGADLDDILSAIVGLAVRSIVTGVGSGGVFEKIYSDLAYQVYTRKINRKSELLAELRKHLPDDNKFRSHFSTLTVSRAQLARFFLHKIEAYLSGCSDDLEVVANQNSQVVNLEHILPQTPSEAWKIDRQEAKRHYRRLGNMTLLLAKKNSKIGNADFLVKKSVFSRSSLKLNEDVAKESCWTITEIENRQKKFAELAVKIWKIN